MTDTLLLVIAIISICHLAIHIYLRKVDSGRVKSADQRVEVPTSYQPDSGIQDHVLQRETEFDQRMDELRQELDLLARATTFSPNEFDPDVKNLPHNSINHLVKARPEIAD